MHASRAFPGDAGRSTLDRDRDRDIIGGRPRYLADLLAEGSSAAFYLPRHRMAPRQDDVRYGSSREQPDCRAA